MIESVEINRDQVERKRIYKHAVVFLSYSQRGYASPGVTLQDRQLVAKRKIFSGHLECHPKFIPNSNTQIVNSSKSEKGGGSTAACVWENSNLFFVVDNREPGPDQEFCHIQLRGWLLRCHLVLIGFRATMAGRAAPPSFRPPCGGADEQGSPTHQKIER